MGETVLLTEALAVAQRFAEERYLAQALAAVAKLQTCYIELLNITIKAADWATYLYRLSLILILRTVDLSYSFSGR